MVAEINDVEATGASPRNSHADAIDGQDRAERWRRLSIAYAAQILIDKLVPMLVSKT